MKTTATKKYTGKSFGALKTAVIRTLRKGYAPEFTGITVSVADRERLRIYCEENGIGSMLEAFGLLLDSAGVKKVASSARKGGRLETLVTDLKVRSHEFDGVKLAERVRDGEFDEYLTDMYL